MAWPGFTQRSHRSIWISRVTSPAGQGAEGNELADAAIDDAITRKPKGHDFVIDRRHKRPALSRHMSVTGG